MMWFENIANEFQPRALEFAGRPITYVEVGVWRGDASDWVCQHVLTHPESSGYGIDPYLYVRRREQDEMDRAYQHAKERLAKYPRYRLLRSLSTPVLRNWIGLPIDLLYLDGSHLAIDVLTDFVLAWPHLSVGAGVIIDDYGIGLRKHEPHVPEAVAAIEQCFVGLVERWGDTLDKQAAFKVVRKIYNWRAKDRHLPFLRRRRGAARRARK